MLSPLTRQKRAAGALVPFDRAFAASQAARGWAPAATTGVGRLALAGAALGAGVNVYAGEGNETDEGGYVQPSDARSRLTRAAVGAAVGGLGAAALKYYRNKGRLAEAQEMREAAVAHANVVRTEKGDVHLSPHAYRAYAQNPHNVQISYEYSPYFRSSPIRNAQTLNTADFKEVLQRSDETLHYAPWYGAADAARAAAVRKHVIADDAAINHTIAEALGQRVADPRQTYAPQAADPLVRHLQEMARQEGRNFVIKNYHPDALGNSPNLTAQEKARFGAAFARWNSAEDGPTATRRARPVEAYAQRVARQVKQRHDALLSGVTSWF